MKVCIVAMTGLYPLDIGGPAPVAYFLAKELNRNGIDVMMFIRADSEKNLKFKNTEEIKELKRTEIIPIDVTYNAKTFLNIQSLIYKVLEANKRFKEILKDVDVIFYNSPPVDVVLCFPFISKQSSKKQVFALHGGLFYESKNLVGKLLMQLQKNWFDKVVAVSAFSRDIALKFGFSRDKIEIISNGIDLDPIRAAEPFNLLGCPKILHVGRLAQIKGVDTLLKAFSIIIKNFPEAHLYLVGDGPERSNLEKLSDSLGIMGNTHFEGFIPPGKDVFRYYKSCDLFVMPSHKETFGITLLEAMASKIPVIVADIDGGPRELIKNGENGFLFPVGDYKILAEKIIEVFENKNLMEKFVSENYSLIEDRYTWRKIILKYMALFKTLERKN